MIKSNVIAQISWLHYCWKRFPRIKPRNKWEKQTLSLDYLQTQYTDFVCQPNCHDCWRLCWLIWITESVCTWTSLNREFLHWSVARSQNTVASRRVARGKRGNAAHKSKVCRLMKYFRYKPKKHFSADCKSTKLPQRTHPTSAFGRIQTCIWPFVIINQWPQVQTIGTTFFCSCFWCTSLLYPTQGLCKLHFKIIANSSLITAGVTNITYPSCFQCQRSLKSKSEILFWHSFETTCMNMALR